MSGPGFEGIGDFGSDDPWQRYIAHQAAKGNYPRQPLDGDKVRRDSKLGRPRVDKLDPLSSRASGRA